MPNALSHPLPDISQPPRPRIRRIPILDGPSLDTAEAPLSKPPRRRAAPKQTGFATVYLGIEPVKTWLLTFVDR